MWRAAEHSDDENTRWSWLRAIEWINWPIFLSQPVVPILLYFYPLSWDKIIYLLLIADVAWQIGVSRRFVSVRFASFGCLFVHLKWIACPVSGYLIWKNDMLFQAIGAVLWPIGVLLIQTVVNVPLGVIFKTTDIGPVQNQFMLALGYSRRSQ